jgi:hypothetical protein
VAKGKGVLHRAPMWRSLGTETGSYAYFPVRASESRGAGHFRHLGALGAPIGSRSKPHIDIGKC